MNMSPPYQGSAPTPARSVELPNTGQEYVLQDPAGQVSVPGSEVGTGFGQQAPQVTPTSPDAINRGPAPAVEMAPGVPDLANFGQIQSSAPPAEPSLAAQVAELRTQTGKLINALGEKDKQHQQELERIQYEMSLNSFGAPPQGLPQPQAGHAGAPAQEFDPNKEMTMGQFVQAMQNWHPMVAADAAAQTTRATWDVTPQEEAEALAAFPRLQQIAEPFRTPKIQEAVRILRRGKQPQQQQQAPAQSQPGNGTNGVAPITRSLEHAHISPLVEGNFAAPPELPTGGPGAPDGSTDAARARAEYEAAKRIPDQKQKLAAMRVASQKMQRIAGVSDRQILGSAWINRS